MTTCQESIGLVITVEVEVISADFYHINQMVLDIFWQCANITGIETLKIRILD